MYNSSESTTFANYTPPVEAIPADAYLLRKLESCDCISLAEAYFLQTHYSCEDIPLEKSAKAYFL